MTYLLPLILDYYACQPNAQLAARADAEGEASQSHSSLAAPLKPAEAPLLLAATSPPA